MPEQAMQGRSNPAFHFCDAMEFPEGFWDWEPDEQEAWVEALITDVCKQQWEKRRAQTSQHCGPGDFTDEPDGVRRSEES